MTRPGGARPSDDARNVTIVIPYYEDQAGLDRLFVGLELQEPRTAAADVVVADDGSEAAPDVARCPWPCQVVRQPDRGFRAAAARNLGAQVATGEHLVFCDGDMVPEPGWLTALTGVLDADPGALVTGRRRHADLAALAPDRLRRWLRGDERAAPCELPEPAWLTDGYRETDGLRQADGDSWRFVISAVLACRRDLFEALSGFDEAFCRYGGEDWDLAYRAQNCGAVLRYASHAVAWHDGPDWAGRDGRADKTIERLELALRIPRPLTRPAGWRVGTPAVVIRLAAGAHLDDPAWQDAVVAILCGTEALVEVVDPGPPSALPPWFDLDPRIVRAEPVGQWAQRVRLRVELHRPVELAAGTIDALLAETDVGGAPAVERTVDGELVVSATPTWASWHDDAERRPRRPGGA